MLKRLLAALGATALVATLLVAPVGCGEEEPQVPPPPRDEQDSGQSNEPAPLDEPALPGDDDGGTWGQND